MGKDTMSKSYIHPPSRGNLSAWLLLHAPNPACLTRCSNPESHRKTILISVLFWGVRSLDQLEGKESESLKVGRWDFGQCPVDTGLGCLSVSKPIQLLCCDCWVSSVFLGLDVFSLCLLCYLEKCSSFWVCLVLPSGSLKLCLNVE